MKTSTVTRIAIAGLIGAAAVVGLFGLPVNDYVVRFLDWVDSMGVWGPVFLAAAYVIACVLFVPGWILTLGAGFLFGLVRGTIAVSLGSVLGATLAFLIGRGLLRDWIEKRMGTYPRFQTVDRAIGREGFKIVLLLRLSPLFPFNLMNYALGLTKVSTRKYVLASWIGMLPVTIVYVYIGSALKSLSEVAAGTPRDSTTRTTLFVVGLLMTFVATIVITRVANRALNAVVEE
jgi:uncharacterized membrane protein YdjX (TVP38/TMEM64 family)